MELDGKSFSLLTLTAVVLLKVQLHLLKQVLLLRTERPERAVADGEKCW